MRTKGGILGAKKSRSTMLPNWFYRSNASFSCEANFRSGSFASVRPRRLPHTGPQTLSGHAGMSQRCQRPKWTPSPFRPTLTDLNRPTGRPKAVCMSLEVAVIGGGIGGLSAALHSLKVGLDVHVYEQAPRIAEIGAGIQIAPTLPGGRLNSGLVRQWTPSACAPSRCISGAGTMAEPCSGAARSRGRGAIRRALLSLSPR